MVFTDFFKEEYLDEICERSMVKKYLKEKNVKLFNYTTIQNETKNLRKLQGFNYKTGEQISSTTGGLVFESLIPSESHIMKRCATNVRSGYIKDELRAIKDIIDNDQSSKSIDIIIVLDERKERVAFGIIQWSECKMKPDIPALKIICALPGGYGDIIMYSYIYCLKKYGLSQGILELSEHFDNMSGLCLYNKYGFKEDMEMKNFMCFPEVGTLPMSSDVDEISFDKLDRILSLSFKNDADKDPTIKSEIDNSDYSEPLCDDYWKTKNDDEKTAINKKRTHTRYVNERIRLQNNKKFQKENAGLEDAEAMKEISENLKKTHKAKTEEVKSKMLLDILTRPQDNVEDENDMLNSNESRKVLSSQSTSSNGSRRSRTSKRSRSSDTSTSSNSSRRSRTSKRSRSSDTSTSSNSSRRSRRVRGRTSVQTTPRSSLRNKIKKLRRSTRLRSTSAPPTRRRRS